MAWFYENLDFNVWGQKVPPKQQSGGRKRPQNRPVWLEAKPQIRIEHIAVDAKMDGPNPDDTRPTG